MRRRHGEPHDNAVGSLTLGARSCAPATATSRKIAGLTRNRSSDGGSLRVQRIAAHRTSTAEIRSAFLPERHYIMMDFGLCSSQSHRGSRSRRNSVRATREIRRSAHGAAVRASSSAGRAIASDRIVVASRGTRRLSQAHHRAGRAIAPIAIASPSAFAFRPRAPIGSRSRSRVAAGRHQASWRVV